MMCSTTMVRLTAPMLVGNADHAAGALVAVDLDRAVQLVEQGKATIHTTVRLGRATANGSHEKAVKLEGKAD
jgi:hypothetical protein